MKSPGLAIFLVAMALVPSSRAGVGDPQARTDDPWSPGELSCSTFDRLFATQADLYRRATGREVRSDQDKALASWYWRNLHYWHGEEGATDLWGLGHGAGLDRRNREYWTGLFGNGFGLCGTTHSQWTAEMEVLLGHGRGRAVGVEGHSSFEVFLGFEGRPGKWALLDHDLSTVVFDTAGETLLSIPEVRRDLARLVDRGYLPDKQHGWLVCGLDAGDGQVYRGYNAAEPLAGYAGPPPMVHLRRGESLRRHLEPGLDDGRTFAYWGINSRGGGIPGPSRSETWVNQPGAMHGSRTGTGRKPGRARFANAVYRYEPDFSTPDYREGVVEEDARHVTFAFATPYVIAATPPDDSPWGIYRPGCRGGLVLRGKAGCPVGLSTDGGATWQDCGRFVDGLDLTDRVKGRQQYLLRFDAPAADLAGLSLVIVTTCQANASTMPHLKDSGTLVTFEASGRAIASAGPELPHARARLVAGDFGTADVTLELAPPRGDPAVEVHAAAHVRSGAPPDPAVRHRIDYSTDRGATWTPVVADWTVPRIGEQPAESWSQSFCWGSARLPSPNAGPIRVRFRNDGRKPIERAEAHLTYRLARTDTTDVTFDWSDGQGPHRSTHRFAANPAPAPSSWSIPTGKDVHTRWVEFKPVATP